MTTITKERIELFIKNPLENGLTRGEQMELARIALASLEAEPVAKIIAHYPLGVDVGKQKFVQAIRELPDFGGYLFAAPPAPIVRKKCIGRMRQLKAAAKRLHTLQAGTIAAKPCFSPETFGKIKIRQPIIFGKSRKRQPALR